MLETWVWEQHLIEIGDIHITMDDLHRTVHILHIICIHILHDANDLEYTTGSMLTGIVNIEPVFSLSRHFHVGATENDERNRFMVEQRRMTREIGLVWCEIASPTRRESKSELQWRFWLWLFIKLLNRTFRPFCDIQQRLSQNPIWVRSDGSPPNHAQKQS